jgi:hypothetical protein
MSVIRRLVAALRRATGPKPPAWERIVRSKAGL